MPQLEQQTAVTTTEAFPLSAVFVYSAVTAVVIIGLLLTVHALDRHPVVLLNPDTSINNGWTPVTDGSLHFTLDIPPTWQSFENQNPRQPTDFDRLLAGDVQYTTAVSLLNQPVSDTELLLMVIGDKPEHISAVPGFVIVARSEMLGRFTLDEIVALVQQTNTMEIQQINMIRSFIGDNRASLSLIVPTTSDVLLCQQHVIQGPVEGYFLLGCAPEIRYQAYSEPIEKILASFQLLR